MRGNSLAPGCVILGLLLALSYTFDGVVALGVQPGHFIWATFMIGCVGIWFRLRRRDPTGTADSLGFMIGVLLAALGRALG